MAKAAKRGAAISSASSARARRRKGALQGFSLLLLASTALVGASQNAFSQTITNNAWTGAVSGDWFDAGNWSRGLVPEFEDEVVIGNAPVQPVIAPEPGNNFASVNAFGMSIGNAAGANGFLTVNMVNPGDRMFLSVQSVFGGGTGVLTVGGNGGFGRLDVNLAADVEGFSPSRMEMNTNLTVGDGGSGTVNVLSGGKNRELNGDSQSNALVTATGAVGVNGGSGTVNVTDAAWVVNFRNPNDQGLDGLHVGFGSGSTGAVNVLSGGKVSYGMDNAFPNSNPVGQIGIVIGESGGTGVITISGANAQPSTLQSGAGVYVGHGAGSTGTVNLLGGGKFLSFNGSEFNSNGAQGVMQIGVAGGDGHVLVSDSGSTFMVGGAGRPSDPEEGQTGDLFVGHSGTGSLTIANDGLVHVGTVTFERGGQFGNFTTSVPATPNGIVYLGYEAGATGALNFGAAAGQAPAAPGTLAADGVVFGQGGGAIVFNHTGANLQFSQPISGQGQIDVHSGTTWITTDNSAGFTHMRRTRDPNTFELVNVPETFAAGFTGPVNLHGGTLGLADDFAVGAGVIHAIGDVGAPTLAYGTDAQAARGVAIANAVTVDSGVTLGLATDVLATQTGAISGAGGVNKLGTGSLTLTAANSLNGEVVVSAGTLALSGAGSVAQAQRVTANASFDISAATGAASIKSLAGSGAVNLGANALTLTAANDLFSGVISGAGGLTLTGGAETLSGANVYSGPTTVSGGTLRAGAVNAFSPNSAYSIASGATLDLAGFSQSASSVSSAGTIITGGAGATQLTVSGEYVGQNGLLNLNTVLGGDGSASDTLVINGGHASGSTGMIISNIGGQGAQTTGNGILVVDDVANNSTDPGSFTLAAPAVAGPYEYSLYRGGNDGAAPESWFLRSTIDCSLDPESVFCGGPNPPPAPIPEIRREVSLYAAVQPMAAIYGRELIDTLHERMGEGELLRERGDVNRGVVAGENGWGRLIGHWGHRDADVQGIPGFAGPEFDYDFGALQVGSDIYGAENASGDLDRAGIYAAFGHGEMDVTHHLAGLSISGGENSFNAVSLGGYWTRYFANGFYVDAVAQATNYDMTTRWRRGLFMEFPDQDIDGFGLAGSLEAGYAFALSNGWRLEPQAQIVAQHVNFDDFNDTAADVRFNDLNAAAGRVGARLSRTWMLSQGSKLNPPRALTLWGQADLWRDFSGNSEVALSSEAGFIPFAVDLGRTWAKAGVGGSVQTSKNTMLYGSLNYESSFDGDAHGVNGKIGLKVTW